MANAVVHIYIHLISSIRRHGYYFFHPLFKTATIRGWLLIRGGIYLANAKLACCSSVCAFFSKLHNSASKGTLLNYWYNFGHLGHSELNSEVLLLPR